MTEDTLRRVFDPFFTTKRDGHGLGLAAVSGILRRHGSGAMIESRPGKGTCFHIYIPIPESEGNASGGAKVTSAGKRRGKSPRRAKKR